MAPLPDPDGLALSSIRRFVSGEELATSAPNARLPHAGGLARADALSSLPAPRLALGTPRPLAWRRDPAGLVGWFAVDAPRPVVLAAGFTGERVAWATLALEAREWSWEEGQREALADLPYARAARNWLEAAYDRLHGLEQPVLLPMPGAAFGCQGSATCCKVPYQVEVDAAYQEVLDAIPALGGVQLPRRGDKLVVKPAAGPCGLLSADGRCRVHAALGRPLFPPCALFPVTFAHTPEGLAVATSALCGAARANLGPLLTDRLEDLRRRAAMAVVPPLQTPVYRLAHGKVVSWQVFQAAESEILEILDREGLPLSRRLWLATCVLGAPGDEAEEDVREFLAPFLGLAGGPEPVAPSVLKNFIYSKVVSYPFDLATALNLAIVMALVGGPGEALGWAFMHGGGMGFLFGEAGRERRERLADPAFGRQLLGLTEA